MATHSSILAQRISMDRGAWRAMGSQNQTRLSNSAQHSSTQDLMFSLELGFVKGIILQLSERFFYKPHALSARDHLSYSTMQFKTFNNSHI